MSICNFSNETEPEIGKSSRNPKKKHNANIPNISDNKHSDVSDHYRFAWTPREKKILFPKDAQINKLRKNFSDGNAHSDNIEEKKR
jgi:hypothetical protein